MSSFIIENQYVGVRKLHRACSPIPSISSLKNNNNNMHLNYVIFLPTNQLKETLNFSHKREEGSYFPVPTGIRFPLVQLPLFLQGSFLMLLHLAFHSPPSSLPVCPAPVEQDSHCSTILFVSFLLRAGVGFQGLCLPVQEREGSD